MAIERPPAHGPAHPAHEPEHDTPPPPSPPPVRVITLHHAEHNDSTLYRFEKGCTVQFCPGPSLLGRKVFLYTNYVVTDNAEESSSAEFVRTQYYALEWRRRGDEEEGDGAGDALGVGALLDDCELVAELRLRRAGAFHYYFVYDTASCPAGPQGSGWFQVAPELRAGGAVLPLDAVACQTVLTKCLGPLPRWLRALRPAREAGYNMLHFTPVQELGGSRSSYSIANQLRLDPRYGGDGREPTFADVENVVAHMRNEWKMLSICDIVLNHTANETPWLGEHPEATYNCRDCPHLRPAALLDAALARLTQSVARGELAARGVPARVTQHEHVDALRGEIRRAADELRLHETFQCDAADLVRQFEALARNRVPPPAAAAAAGPLRLLPDPARRRHAASVDLELALRLYNVRRSDVGDEEARVRACGAELRRALDALNAAAADEVRAHLDAAVDNCAAGMRYERLEADGPRVAEVSAARPLVPRYFMWWAGADALPPAELEARVWADAGAGVMAHNGWVMGADPLADFAAREQDGRVYLRRELIAWGDSVKLRYGERPGDCPFLWRHMRDYVELTAEVFDGVRLDNCHSTPLHVAEYLLDCARNVKPDLYVAAELFTNSDHVDNIFVNRLGITSLIREAQSAWDAHEQGRLLHRFGSRPVGAFLRPRVRPAAAAVAHALLLDLTHDNPSPAQRRSVYDLLPTAALVAAANCAVGSTRGYDELVPHHVHVVDEERLYAEWDDGPEPGEGRVGAGAGLTAARRALNALHAELARGGYSEIYVDQLDPDTVAVTRHCPDTRQSVIVVARTAFRPPSGDHPPPRDLQIEGSVTEILLEAELRQTDHKAGVEQHVRHPRYINGLAGFECVCRRAVPPADARLLAPDAADGTLRFRALPPGAVLAVRVCPLPQHRAALAALAPLLSAGRALQDALGSTLRDLDLPDLSALLYRCDAEERDAGGGGVYDVPGHGPLVYAGLQGAVSLLATVRPGDDLGHPLCANLRAGDWLPEYVWRRLEREPRLRALGGKVRELLAPLRELPRYLQPAYFDALLRALHAAAVRAALARLPAWVRADSLARELALTSVQLVARVPSAPLPLPAAPASMSAGLPHFATGYMRCWGRDTFVALRGLLLLTGRAEDARNHILGFGACLRHGLIPNLLDGGPRARYNCRDAVWWWLHAIKQYCLDVPGGSSILNDTVSRLFPDDDSEPKRDGPRLPLHALMQEALDAHFQGRVFRERNAGRDIDAHMTDAGFTVQIGVQPDTGFPFGGNDHNAGTWMDKMGSSERAGTRGRPATPRDGSAVELVGLCYAVVSWLRDEHAAARYPVGGVTRASRDGGSTAWTWAQWAERLRRSFERHFWVPPEPSAADARPDLVHRRGIYKDTHGASRAFADYQLRCNYVVAMAVAPDLFEPKHAWLALDAVERHLLGPLGLKTLDPADWAYRPNYDNADDGDDPSTAHGFNYHQGPEWLWPLGFYLRARLAFAQRAGAHARTVAAVLRALGPLADEIRTSPWRGLPELSNAGGAYCAHSCRSQAWSSAVVLEVLHELRAARRATSLD